MSSIKFHCCRCEESDIWLDYCAACGLTLCPECAVVGCCGASPMASGSFGPTPKWPETYADFIEHGAKPLQALACLRGPRPLPKLRGGEAWEALVRMHDAGMLTTAQDALDLLPARAHAGA